MDPRSRFREIVALAATEFGPASGAPEIIRFGAALVDLVRSHPAEHAMFEAEFVASEGIAPLELLEFCMHALRWESLHTHFQNQQEAALARNDCRAEPYYRGILESFSDNWEDADDFYALYFRSHA